MVSNFFARSILPPAIFLLLAIGFARDAEHFAVNIVCERMRQLWPNSLNFRLILTLALCLLVQNGSTAQSSGSHSSGSSSSVDWPEFRGPGGQGISNARNVPLNWSSSSNIVWRTEIPGLGWSSPVLRGGRLYITTAV